MNHERYLFRFLTHTGAKKPKDVTAMLREYRPWLNRQGLGVVIKGRHETLKRKTQNYYFIISRVFLKYLRRRDIQSMQPERIVKHYVVKSVFQKRSYRTLFVIVLQLIYYKMALTYVRSRRF